jgi:hypothetical protein
MPSPPPLLKTGAQGRATKDDREQKGNRKQKATGNKRQPGTNERPGTKATKQHLPQNKSWNETLQINKNITNSINYH